MKAAFETYIQAISSKFAHEETSEMGYRTDFETLMNKVFGVINGLRIGHDAKAKHGNKPDFILYKGNIPLLYIETKDIGVSLDKIESSDQMKRYFGYSNLILTDYNEFRFYRNGIRYGEPISISTFDIKSRVINPLPENYIYLAKALLNFTKSYKEPIKSGKHLAQIMGGKAQRIRNDIRLFSLDEFKRETDLVRLYKTLKQLLVHDLTITTFADMYAQTLVYGLFVARYHDKTTDNFSRQEARELIPNSNPFLRHFFDHIVGADFDTRLRYIVDELCEVFSHADVHSLMEEYFGNNGKEVVDPVIHFYEDFLKEYDPELRKKMGAYYTPPPVVSFIIKSVDELLKKSYSLPDGLADTTKLADGKHKVQILDPATGTGTFISEIINNIHDSIVKNNQGGRWFAYIHNDLLPRVHGFELMMAPYTIAHLRLGIEFRKMGFWTFNRRLSIYLTNSLEGGTSQDDMFTAFGLADSIAEESKEANKIKTQTPIMVVVGNPPYSGESSNKEYSGNDVYKKEPSGGKLQEKNPKWLNDDYVKFIRFAESMVEKTGEGIVAMITAHGYIDNPTFRGMRYHLMRTFDEIYILDLHGNTNKKETSPDGGIDQNVFNIKTGVAIFIGVKHNTEKNPLAAVFHADLFGERLNKFEYLNANTLKTVDWTQLVPKAPYYDWAPQNEANLGEYNKGFSLDEAFITASVGIVTARDNTTIQFTREDIERVAHDFLEMDTETLRNKYKLGKDARDWKVLLAKTDVENNFSENNFLNINYKPFDIRWTFYTGNSKGFHCMPRNEVMRNLVNNDLSLVILRQVKSGQTYQHALVAKGIVESTFVSNKTGEIGYVLPLYLYTQDAQKASNIKKTIFDAFERIVGNTTPENILDYIYAILYSPKYINEYNQFLMKAFPRIAYPKNRSTFNKIVTLGNHLRHLHLLESPNIKDFITSFSISGSDKVETVPTFRDGRVYINETQYFGSVPEKVWNYYLGSYQPAQKWLKDRKGRTLTNEDIEHYQKMIVAINETIKTVHQIDEILEI